MRLGGESVGRWGTAVLAAAGLAGAALGWHGWAARHAGPVPVLSSGSAGSGAGGAPSAPVQPSGSAAPSAGAPGPSARPSSPAGSSGKAGPPLSSEPFANVAFQVWPGTPSVVARQALTGLHVVVRKVPGGLSVVAGVNGQPPAQPHVYRGGARVYVVEASMGDDSGNSEYNLGDDGLVVVNAQGRIIE